MSSADYKRRERAKEALLKALIWALSCGVDIETMVELAKSRMRGK